MDGMNNEEILRKCLDKAKMNWYDHYRVTRVNLPDGRTLEGQSEIIYSHDFANALWGEEFDKFEYESDGFKSYMPNWQYHLQQMVVSEDPIKYLEQFLDK